ncbi:MAG: xanthine dehydrogenase family protein molybdopterin-binding subunit [Rhodospirillales bacterium]|nr:xanthine dehydrogenase family protein molybdopterin-binding subunit [Rhodospirillales bacterium]
MNEIRSPFKTIGTRPVRHDGVDKVTGRAKFGADFSLPGMLVGKTLRSPHPHARIKAIRLDKALKIPGVKAAVTAADMVEFKSEWAGAGRVEVNLYHLSCNVLARTKALYEGHAIAAVAATTSAIADAALAAIEVDYEVLPHVIDEIEAMQPGAPLLFEEMTTRGANPPPTTPSNIAKEFEVISGDVAAGFAKADVIVERTFKTRAVHQAYIEPMAAIADVTEDGQCTIWSCTQGQFQARAHCAKFLGMDMAKIRVIPAEVGGGFGGKLNVYLEPLVVMLSKKAGKPVKMVMSREEVFRGTGPTSGGTVTVKMGVTKDGKITAGEAKLIFQAGAFPGSPVGNAAMTAFAAYDVADVRAIGYDVVSNRPKCSAYRAPGAPISAFAVEGVLDEIAQRLKMDPIELRLKNAVREGSKTAYGMKFAKIGFIETLEAAKKHPHYSAPLKPNQGRGVASGFWFNGGGDSTAAVNISEDGNAMLITGSPDLTGSRVSLAMMAAEVLGIDVSKVQPAVGDTNAIGYTFVTGGSRTTFATGMAVVEATKNVVKDLCRRAAMIWEVEADAVVWEDGHARPAGANVGKFKPLSLKDIAGQAGKTGGPISGHASLTAQGIGPAFGTHICDVDVDRETGRVTVTRYTIVQDAGRAIHPSYVEGQLQGGVVQGIGWALNEEYIYGKDGKLQNPGFLDYRLPVASDVPMIDAVIVEVPNPGHPFGVRGTGEVPIVPPMAAIANAVANALGMRIHELPLSPPRVLAALDRKA